MRIWKYALILIIVLFSSLLFQACDCEEEDDDDGKENNQSDDDDDFSTTVYLFSPTDVDEDGQPELVLVDFELEEISAEITIELYDLDSGNFPKATSETYDAYGGWDATIGDFDGDGFSEIRLNNLYDDGGPTSVFRLLDGPELESVFSRSHSSGVYSSDVEPDFNNDGVIDFFIAYYNADILGTRYVFYDATEDDEIIWDSEESEQTRLNIFGTHRNLNFDTPGDFGSLGQGWLVIEDSTETGDRLTTFRIIDTSGNSIWVDGPSNFGEFGGAFAMVEDFTGNGTDEILMVTIEDDGVDQTFEWGVYEPPNFDPIYIHDVLPDHENYFGYFLDINNDGVNELLMIDVDTTDFSFEISFLDGTNNFEEIVSKGFTADYAYYTMQFLGERVGPNRSIPTSFAEGSSDQLLFAVSELVGGSFDCTLYTFDPDTANLDPIRTYEGMIWNDLDAADYDNDGYMEITSCPTFIIDNGIDDPYLESYCEILDGSSFELVHRTDTYLNTTLNATRRLDLDFDDIPEPGIFTTAQTPESASFFRVLDGTDNYSEKFAVIEGPGHTLWPLLMGR